MLQRRKIYFEQVLHNQKNAFVEKMWIVKKIKNQK